MACSGGGDGSAVAAEHGVGVVFVEELLQGVQVAAGLGAVVVRLQPTGLQSAAEMSPAGEVWAAPEVAPRPSRRRPARPQPVPPRSYSPASAP